MTGLTPVLQVDDQRNVTHKLIADLENAHGVADVNCVSWSPMEEGLLASAGDDCTSRVWTIAHSQPP
jgi:WD40 repeat protein